MHFSFLVLLVIYCGELGVGTCGGGLCRCYGVLGVVGGILWVCVERFVMYEGMDKTFMKI